MKCKNLINNLIFNNTKRDQGLALIEVIISITILSLVLLRIYPIFILNMNIIGDSKNQTKALMLAKSLMNEFRNDNMREADITDSPIDNYPDFTYDRTTIRYEDDFITPMIEPLIINKATITVKWKYKDKERSSELSMIYQDR